MPETALKRGEQPRIEPEQPRSARGPSDAILETVLGLVIAGGVVAFGGVEKLAYSLGEIVLFLCFLLLVIRQVREGRLRILLPIWPLLFTAWVALQLVPLPRQLVALVSPGRAADASLPGFPPRQWLTLSIYPHDTELALLKLLAYLCAFALAAYLFDYRRRESRLIKILIAVGCFEACYGAVQYLTGWQKIFTYTRETFLENATGTYVNHNHFAGFMEMCLPFVLTSVFYKFQIWMEERGSKRGRRRAARSSPAAFQTLFFVIVLVLMAVTVIFSGSRGGIVAVVLSLLFAALLAQFKVGKRIWLAGLLFFLVVVGGYAAWVGIDPLLSRFERIRQPEFSQAEVRVSVLQDGLPLVRAYPITGTGFGTFMLAFRQFQTKQLKYVFTHAHNDYLELASDTGLVGLALLFVPIIVLLLRMVVSFVTDTRRYRRSVTLGCIAAIMAMVIHTAVDFNLEIPANALVFAVVLGIGYKAALVDRAEVEDRGQGH